MTAQASLLTCVLFWFFFKHQEAFQQSVPLTAHKITHTSFGDEMDESVRKDYVSQYEVTPEVHVNRAPEHTPKVHITADFIM